MFSRIKVNCIIVVAVSFIAVFKGVCWLSGKWKDEDQQ